MTYVVITFRILLNAYIFIVEINYIILGYCSKIYNVIIYIMVLNHIRVVGCCESKSIPLIKI